MAFRNSDGVQEALAGDILRTFRVDFWEMDWVDGLDNVEVIIVVDADLWVSELASHDHLGEVLVPGGTMATSWIVSSVDENVIVTGGLEGI